MNITSQMVKELREKTNAGMMDCKKALTETDGNMEKAVDLLRQKGLAVAAKRAGKETREGVIEAYIHGGGKIGVMVEVACETDFVAKTDDFKAARTALAAFVLAESSFGDVAEGNVEALKAMPCPRTGCSKFTWLGTATTATTSSTRTTTRWRSRCGSCMHRPASVLAPWPR